VRGSSSKNPFSLREQPQIVNVFPVLSPFKIALATRSKYAACVKGRWQVAHGNPARRMTSRVYTKRLVCGLLASLLLLHAGSGSAAHSPGATNGASTPLLFPSFLVKDESGRSVPLFSHEAYNTEFNYLRRTLHQIDLKGPPVKTDGWESSIPDAEWPFMTCCYFGYACANLARCEPSPKEYLEEMRWLIEAIQTPRLSGFMEPHFGPPFGKNKMGISVFLHGHFLNLCLRYRSVSNDKRYDGLIVRVAEGLNGAFGASSAGVLKSYEDMWWISDNLPALAALAEYDRQFKRDTTRVREKFLAVARGYYMDGATGLLVTYVDADAREVLQGPRGVSTMYGLHFLRDIAPALAQDQYARACRHFVRTAFGLAAVREFPEGVNPRPDVDSGPLFLGIGPSASGFAIAASAVMGDDETAESLLKSLALAALPELRSGELRYTSMPPVGQAVILFGKTELLKYHARSR